MLGALGIICLYLKCKVMKKAYSFMLREVDRTLFQGRSWLLSVGGGAVGPTFC